MNSKIFSDQEDQFEEMEYYDTRQERRERKTKKLLDQTPRNNKEFGKHTKSSDKRWRTKEVQY